MPVRNDVQFRGRGLAFEKHGLVIAALFECTPATPAGKLVAGKPERVPTGIRVARRDHPADHQQAGEHILLVPLQGSADGFCMDLGLGDIDRGHDRNASL